jgi:hypothetical protein
MILWGILKSLLIKESNVTESKFTMKGFYKFCKSKNPLEKINNRYWSTCALGLYMKSIGEPFPENDSGFFTRDLNLPTRLDNLLCDGMFYEFGDLVGFIEQEYSNFI